MTDQEMRVAIAEACGWKFSDRALRWPDGSICASDEDPSTTIETFSYLLPDYLSDLNAMHEAVRSQNNAFTVRYAIHLEHIVERDRSTHGEDDRIVHCLTSEATAKQRAEAMCRTLFPERFKE